MASSQKPVWLITGCSTGLGAALATQVLQSGHRVVATARNPATLSYLPDTPDALRMPLDVTSKNDITSTFSAVIAKFGRVDYVVNNAGYGIFVEAEATSEKEARGIFETNFWGSSNVAVEAIRIFRDHNPRKLGGMLIQISSTLGIVGVGGQSFYCSSKFAVEGFIESLSKEIHPKWNIKVLIAEPGAIKGTAFTRRILESRDIHPAYRDAEVPTSKTRKWLTSPNLEENFTPATLIAATLFDAIINGNLPLRLPLGQDSWEAIYNDESEFVKSLREWHNVSKTPSNVPKIS